MDKQSIFKTSFYGFDKEAVLKYIDEMSEKATDSETLLQGKVDELAKSREQLEQQIQSFDDRIKCIDEELNIEKGKNVKLSEMIDNLQLEIDRQRRQGEVREREYLIQQEQTYNLKARAESAEQKSLKYDEATGTIGTAILEAQQTAKRIIDVASEKAVVISKDANVMITNILNKIEGMKTDFTQLRGKMDESIEMLNSRFDEIEQEIENSKDIVLKSAEAEVSLIEGRQNEEKITSEKRVEEKRTEEKRLDKKSVKTVEFCEISSSKKESNNEQTKNEVPLGRLSLSEQELQKHRYF